MRLKTLPTLDCVPGRTCSHHVRTWSRSRTATLILSSNSCSTMQQTAATPLTFQLRRSRGGVEATPTLPLPPLGGAAMGTHLCLSCQAVVHQLLQRLLARHKAMNSSRSGYVFAGEAIWLDLHQAHATLTLPVVVTGPQTCLLNETNSTSITHLHQVLLLHEVLRRRWQLGADELVQAGRSEGRDSQEGQQRLGDAVVDVRALHPTARPTTPRAVVSSGGPTRGGSTGKLTAKAVAF